MHVGKGVSCDCFDGYSMVGGDGSGGMIIKHWSAKISTTAHAAAGLRCVTAVVTKLFRSLASHLPMANSTETVILVGFKAMRVRLWGSLIFVNLLNCCPCLVFLWCFWGVVFARLWICFCFKCFLLCDFNSV